MGDLRDIAQKHADGPRAVVAYRWLATQTSGAMERVHDVPSVVTIFDFRHFEMHAMMEGSRSTLRRHNFRLSHARTEVPAFGVPFSELHGCCSGCKHVDGIRWA